MNPTRSTHRIFRGLPALLLALAAFGLMQLAAQAQIALPAGLKIMPLGDSITLGDGSAAGSGYRYPLYARLNPLAPSFQFVGASSVSPGALPDSPLDQRFHNGRESYSCNDINNNLDGLDSGTFNLYGGAGRDPNGGYWLTGGNGTGRAAVYPDAILLLAAANDISRVGMTGVQARIEALLTKITTLRPAARVFLAKSNPYVGYETEVNTFNGLIVTVAANFQAAGKKITVVDLNTNFPADGLSDAVHPNQTGYNWMADRWYDALVGFYGAPTTPPAVPTGLTAIPLDGSVVLGWTATPGATLYKVERSTTGGPPYTEIRNDLTGPGYADSPLSDGTTYTYVVSAWNVMGWSARAGPISATPLVGVATTTTLTSSGTPSIYGNPVTITATVTPTPTGGTVQFYDNNVALGGPVTVSGGHAQYATSVLVAGSHPVTATFSGYSGSHGSVTAGPLSQMVNKATPVVTVTGTTSFTYNGSAQGPNTATTGGSTGALTYNYAGVSGTTYGPGATPPTLVGSYIVTATVAADANYLSASSSASAFAIVKATPVIPLSSATGVFLANTVAGGNGTLANTSWAIPNSYALTGGSSWNVLTDGVTSTKWDACGTEGWGAYPGTSGKGAGFYFTLPVAANMQSIRFFTEDTSPGRSPKTMTIEGSNAGDPMSGASWTLVYAGTAGLDTTPDYSAGNTVNFTNATAYTRYRALFPTTVDGNPGGVQLADIVATTGASATSNYGTWAAAQAPPVTGGPAFVGPDGISNLLLYVLDLKLDGTNGSPGALTVNRLSFTKREAAVTNNDVTYSIEISADLGVSDAWHTATGVVESTSIPHTISYTIPTVSGGKLFARLVVTNKTGPP